MVSNAQKCSQPAALLPGYGGGRGEGVTRAHTLESQVHTGETSHYFFHPESSAHTKLESHAHTGQFPGSHVHAEGESHSGGGGGGWGGG